MVRHGVEQGPALARESAPKGNAVRCILALWSGRRRTPTSTEGRLNKCVDTKTLSCSYFGEIGTSKEAREDDVVVILENDGGMLDGGGTGKGDGKSDHWVRLTKPIEFTGEEDTDRAKFQVFTWGQAMDLDWPGNILD